MKVISGAQVGADIAGLRAAKVCGIETGGFIPKGGMTKAGPLPQEWIDFYGLQETNSEAYPMRTLNNVLSSDATIRLAHNFQSPGEKLTHKYLVTADKPWLDVQLQKVRDEWYACFTSEDAARWLLKPRRNIETVNIAGNANPEIEGCVERFLIEVFGKWKKAVTV